MVARSRGVVVVIALSSLEVSTIVRSKVRVYDRSCYLATDERTGTPSRERPPPAQAPKRRRAPPQRDPARSRTARHCRGHRGAFDWPAGGCRGDEQGRALRPLRLQAGASARDDRDRKRDL